MNERKNDGWLDRALDVRLEKRITRYIDQYATKEDGTRDETLARRIRWEVGRRGETGKQLDIYEPLRWTGIRAVLGAVGAGTAKMLTDRITGKTKTLMWGVEIGIIVSTVINSVIDVSRLYPRWLAGLEGGKNTALKLHHEFAPPPNDQAFSPPPASIAENAPEILTRSAIAPVSLLAPEPALLAR